MRLGSRPWLHPVLEGVCRRALPCATVSARSEGVAAIHFVGTGWNFFGFAAAAAARRNGARFTIWPAVHPYAWGDDAIDIRLYKKADSVFCQSDYEKRHLAERGVPEAKLIFCGLPAMCDTRGDGARLRSKLEIGDRPAVFFLGRRDEGKGYPALLRAWKQVVRNYPEAVLLLAGPGGEEFEMLKTELPGNSVFDLGVPDEEEKADALAACHVFCLPSASESFGIVYVEAWLYEKPVVCGTAPACRELVEDGKTGLWASQDSQVIVEKLGYLLGHRHEARVMGVAGRAFQLAHYRQELMLGIHLEAWRIPSSRSVETPEVNEPAAVESQALNLMRS